MDTQTITQEYREHLSRMERAIEPLVQVGSIPTKRSNAKSMPPPDGCQGAQKYLVVLGSPDLLLRYKRAWFLSSN
jgi:hypothetical protein